MIYFLWWDGPMILRKVKVSLLAFLRWKIKLPLSSIVVIFSTCKDEDRTLLFLERQIGRPFTWTAWVFCVPTVCFLFVLRVFPYVFRPKVCDSETRQKTMRSVRMTMMAVLPLTTPTNCPVAQVSRNQVMKNPRNWTLSDRGSFQDFRKNANKSDSSFTIRSAFLKNQPSSVDDERMFSTVRMTTSYLKNRMDPQVVGRNLFIID